MHALGLINVGLHTKFEVPGFIHSEKMMGPQKFFLNRSRDPDHTNLTLGCRSKVNP